MATFADLVPTMAGGAADLSESTKTEFPGDGERYTRERAGRNVFYGREGDIIEGRYRIVRIGLESIEMMHVDGRGQQTIRLSGS